MVRALLEVRRRGKHPAAIVWSPLNKRRYHRGPGSPGLHTAARGAAASGRLPRSDSKRVSSTMNESPPPPLPHTHTHTGQKFSAFRFLPYALISLCRRERAPLLRLCICLLGNSDTSSVSRKGEQFVLFLENYFFPALLVHSKILRSLEIEENCFFLGTLYLFSNIFCEIWKLTRRICLKNYFSPIREQFCSLFQYLFIFWKISRERKIIGEELVARLEIGTIIILTKKKCFSFQEKKILTMKVCK